MMVQNTSQILGAYTNIRDTTVNTSPMYENDGFLG